MKKLLTDKIYSIPIPHLAYKIVYGVDPKEFVGRQTNSQMFTEDKDRHTAVIVFRKTPTDLEGGTVAHEIMHALQYMCRRRNICMEDELEHMGYLMQYIFNEIYGRKYNISG